MREILNVVFGVLVVFDVLILYCCCVAAGEADRQMERLQGDALDCDVTELSE